MGVVELADIMCTSSEMDICLDSWCFTSPVIVVYIQTLLVQVDSGHINWQATMRQETHM